jgi:hypothetical protein
MKNQSQLARAAACLLLAASSVHAYAQQAADPQAAVPATTYQSALGSRPEAAPATSPDANWVKSNETVAATNSMALTMKGMAGHDHAAMQGMNMDKKDSPAMCTPGGDKAGQGKMSCCGSGCESCCCMDKMKKPKEAT